MLLNRGIVYLRDTEATLVLYKTCRGTLSDVWWLVARGVKDEAA